MAQAKAAKKKSPKRRALSGGSKIPIERLQLVENLMESCCSRRDIAKQVSELYGITAKTALSYYDRVEREWKAEDKEKKSYTRHKMLKKFENIAKKASAKGKFHAAVAALDKICKIVGLYEPEVIEVITLDTHPVEGMTSAQLRSYVQDEMEKAEALSAEAARTGAAVH